MATTPITVSTATMPTRRLTIGIVVPWPGCDACAHVFRTQPGPVRVSRGPRCLPRKLSYWRRRTFSFAKFSLEPIGSIKATLPATCGAWRVRLRMRI